MRQNLSLAPPSDRSSAEVRYNRQINREKRYDVRLQARARQVATDIEGSVIVSNLSRMGCKIETMVPLSSKAPFLLSYRGLPPIKVEVMWSKVGAYGCKFARPLTIDELGCLLNAG